MDIHTPEQRRRNMQAIRSTDTKAEIKLRKNLWSLGYRYRKNDKRIFGKPDLSFSNYKIAVFVDSEFFHGRNWDTAKYKIKTNSEFWHNKIDRNINRDIQVNKILEEQGWYVLRFWDTEVSKNLQYCIVTTERLINERKKSNKI